MKMLATLLSMLCISSPPDSLLERGQQSPQDPVESLRQHPDYIEQRARGVGLGAWGGPIRLDLEIDLQTRVPIRSVYLDRAILSADTDPFSGRIEVALPTSEQEARRAISQTPFSAPEFVFYTHYRGVEAR